MATEIGSTIAGGSSLTVQIVFFDYSQQPPVELDFRQQEKWNLAWTRANAILAYYNAYGERNLAAQASRSLPRGNSFRYKDGRAMGMRLRTDQDTLHKLSLIAQGRDPAPRKGTVGRPPGIKNRVRGGDGHCNPSPGASRGRFIVQAGSNSTSQGARIEAGGDIDSNADPVRDSSPTEAEIEEKAVGGRMGQVDGKLEGFYGEGDADSEQDEEEVEEVWYGSDGEREKQAQILLKAAMKSRMEAGDI